MIQHYYPPSPPLTATVDTDGGAVPLRRTPDISAPVTAHAADGEALTVLNRSAGWLHVCSCGRDGYIPTDFIVLNY